MTKLFLFFAVLMLAAACSEHRTFSEEDYPSRSVSVNDKIYKYRIFVPKNHDPNMKIPVMLYLHGSGSRGDNNQSQLSDIAHFIAQDREKYPFIIVFPQCREDMFWVGGMTEQAIAALDQTVKEFNGDDSRLYLAGFSMGGYGTWQTAITYPNKFAALVPIAGGVVPNGPLSDDQKALLSPAVRAAADAQDPYQAFAKAIGKTPVWIFHGGKDDVVPTEQSRKIFAALKAAGNTNANYTEFENVDHFSVGKAFIEPKLFEWLAHQRLNITK